MQWFSVTMRSPSSIDSILIDEARTPLIISGQGEKSSQLYEIADRFAAQLSCLRVKEVDAKEEQDDIDADYIVDEKAKTATLTPHGQKRAEAYFKVENLSDPAEFYSVEEQEERTAAECEGHLEEEDDSAASLDSIFGGTDDAEARQAMSKIAPVISRQELDARLSKNSLLFANDMAFAVSLKRNEQRTALWRQAAPLP